MKISVVTVSYNAEATIEDTIRSVVNQDYDNIEYLLIDGASKDGTLKIVKGYENYFAEIVSEPDKGIYDAMNKGLKRVSGEVIAFLNADDVYASSDVISKIASALTESHADACYGDLNYVNPSKNNKVHRHWKAGEYREGAFKWGWMPPHPAFFVKAQLYKKYGGFRTELRISADYELMLRFIHKHRATMVYIPEVLVEMKLGGESNSSIGNRLSANREDRLAWKINGLRPSIFTTFLKPFRKITQFSSL